MEQTVCPWYIAYTFDNPFRDLIHRPEKLLSDYIEPGFSVLDVGCGLGYFSLGMARLVGPTGKVFAVDIQDKMLKRVRKRVKSNGLDSIVETRLCTQTDLRLAEPLDFILAFWMVHGVQNQGRFFEQLLYAIKSTGKCLVVEPKIHVSRTDFNNSLTLAESAGLKVIEYPHVSLSRAALLEIDCTCKLSKHS